MDREEQAALARATGRLIKQYVKDATSGLASASKVAEMIRRLERIERALGIDPEQNNSKTGVTYYR